MLSLFVGLSKCPLPLRNIVNDLRVQNRMCQVKNFHMHGDIVVSRKNLREYQTSALMHTARPQFDVSRTDLIVALYCIVLHFIALYFIVLYCAAFHCIVLCNYVS